MGQLSSKREAVDQQRSEGRALGRHARLESVLRSPWERVRYQLGGGILIAVLGPSLLRDLLEFDNLGGFRIDFSIPAAAFGLLAGYYGFRKISAYPGVRPSFHIIPSFSLAFGTALSVLFFARLDYSRLFLALSFFSSLIWYYIVYFKLQRQRLITIGVVPFGNIAHLFGIEGLRWVELNNVHQDLENIDTFVADLRADIPAEWQRFLADQALRGKLVLHRKQIFESLRV